MSLQEKREKMRVDNGKARREEIRSQLRYEREHEQYALQSQTLQDFWFIPYNKLQQSQFELQQAILKEDLQTIDQKDHYDLMADILYLISDVEVKMPPELCFRKDGEQMTAAVVAYLSPTVSTEQLMYWLKYMGDDLLDIVFLSIGEQHYTDYQRWLQNEGLKQFIYTNLHMDSAINMLREMCSSVGSSSLSDHLQEISRMLLGYLYKQSNKSATPMIYIDVVLLLIDAYVTNNAFEAMCKELVAMLNEYIIEDQGKAMMDNGYTFHLLNRVMKKGVMIVGEQTVSILIDTAQMISKEPIGKTILKQLFQLCYAFCKNMSILQKDMLNKTLISEKDRYKIDMYHGCWKCHQDFCRYYHKFDNIIKSTH